MNRRVISEQPVKPVSKWAIKDMFRIINGIEIGELEHFQGDWHCGTAHCFLGWKVTLDAARKLRKPCFLKLETAVWAYRTTECPITFVEGMQKVYGGKDMYSDSNIISYCGDSWGLSYREITKTADGSNSLEAIKEIINHLSNGDRCIAWSYSNYEPSFFRWVTKKEYKEVGRVWSHSDQLISGESLCQ